MKAWQYTGDNEPLALREIDEPTAGPGEVVLDVKGAGICHTDVGYLNGTISSLLSHRPITLGHEVAGIVRELGEGVTDFAVGDRVAVRSALAGPGTSLDGGFQPRLAVPTALLVSVPEGVSWDQAAVSTDAGATSYHAVVVRGAVKAGDKVGIIGFGGLGSLGVQAALGVGAQVHVAEINEGLHDYARSLGVASVSTDVNDFAGLELDVIIDFAGFGTTTVAAVELVRVSGRVVQVGLARTHGNINLLRLTSDEIELLGSLGGSNEDNSKVLELMAEGKLESRTTTVGFDDIPDAIGTLERGETLRRLAVLY